MGVVLYLIRHARPAVEGVLLGRSDPPLSEQGRLEARPLSRIEVERVYSSSLRRAIETAEFLRSRAGVRTLSSLAEISFGAWDGRSWAEIEQADPALARAKQDNWFGVTPPEGETWQAFSRRVTRAFDAIRRGPRPAAIVAHLAVNSVIASIALGASPGSFQQDYCEVIQLDI